MTPSNQPEPGNFLRTARPTSDGASAAAGADLLSSPAFVSLNVASSIFPSSKSLFASRMARTVSGVSVPFAGFAWGGGAAARLLGGERLLEP